MHKLLVIIYLLFASVLSAYAVETTLPGGIHGPEKGLAGFVDNFYRFSLLVAGILAFGAIVWGGIKYTFAAGNPSGQSEGKEWVKSALLGLLLLAGAYLLLSTINPKIVSLNLPGLPRLAPTPTPTSTSTPHFSCDARSAICQQFQSQESCRAAVGRIGICVPGMCPSSGVCGAD